MDRLAHLASAQANLKAATDLTGAGLPDQAGEIFWGTIVQAVSAAESEHENQTPDRFGNIHTAPNTRTDYNAATQRICSNLDKATYPGAPNQTDYDTALRTGQIMLHNYYYHLNLSRLELDAYINTISQLPHRLTEHAAIVHLYFTGP